MVATVLGGIGVFLLGMVLMSDALKALGGGALRRVLTRFVAGPMSGLVSGAAATALVQSSTATTLTTIGFVSAGLLTFPQAVGVIFGANIGTTSTGWLVSLLGFKLSIGAIAMPLVFAGVLIRLLTRERVASSGIALAGFGLIFVGIDLLQSGMAGLAERFSPADFPGAGLGGRAVLVVLGLLMTVIMQSSSAAVATTLTALHAGTINLDQAAAMVIGQNIGTAVTSAIAGFGASAPAKRTAVAHILFNVITGIVAFALLPVFTYMIRGLAEAAGNEPGAVALAAFHTAFNVLGVAMLLPAVGPFSKLVIRLVPLRGPVLTRFLDDTVATLGPVAVEAARRTVIEIALVVTEAARAVVSTEGGYRAATERLDTAQEALRETRRFLGRLGAGPQTRDEQRRHLASLHAIDHVTRLIEACRESEPARASSRDPQLRELSLRLGDALRATRDWLSVPAGPSPVPELERTSSQIAALRREQRALVLERIARGGVDPDETLAELEAMRWIDRIAYHLWRTAHHLQERPPREPAGPAEVHEEPGAPPAAR